MNGGFSWLGPRTDQAELESSALQLRRTAARTHYI